MTAAWEQYFTGPAPVEGGVNWEAYSHEELYQMLWQDADVADVSTVATEWAKHRAALTTHAEVLRDQCVALQDSWQGPGAEEAVRRLEALATRVEKVSELAHAGGQAAQEAADALATARAMMPPPPGSPAMPFAGAAAVPAPSAVPEVPTAPVSSSMASMESYMASMESYLSSMQSSFTASMPAMPNYAEMFTPTTTPSSATTGMSGAFGAVGSAGNSFYFGSVTQDQQKAQAVRAMQTYESSLAGSSQRIGNARGAVPAAAPLASAAGSTTPASSEAGVPWQRLVGSGSGAGLRAGAGTGAVIGGPGAARDMPLAPGSRVGGMPGMAGGVGMQAAHLAETATAARAAGPGGMAPPIGHRGAAADDEPHENRMPILDHGLFAVEEPGISAVIDLTGGQR